MFLIIKNKVGSQLQEELNKVLKMRNMKQSLVCKILIQRRLFQFV